MQGGSLRTRGGDLFGTLPMGTRSVLVLNVGLYVFCILFGYDAFHEVCMAPHWVLHQWQVYRVFTAPLFHGGIIHLVFNMTAFVPMATSLERLLGTVQFLFIVGLFITLSSSFHIAIAVCAGTMGFNAMRECAIGFSGVVFGVIVVDTHLSAVVRRSVFGFFQVPAPWYPVSLLLFLQVVIPKVSFIGHLAGVCVGLAYVNGYLNPLLLRQNTVAAVEAATVFERVVRNQSFVPGGVSADAAPSTGGAAFPTFLNSSGGGFLGNNTNNTSGENRRWWQVPTFARRQQTDDGGDGTFASGRGRRAEPLTVTATPAPMAKEAAAAAAEARLGNKKAVPNRRASGHVCEDGDSQMESMETQATSAMTPAAALMLESDDASLEVLVDMGFGEDSARAALLAAGGDVAGAVEALSGKQG